MIFKVVSIRDRASNLFGRPAHVVALGASIRSFQDEVNRQAADNELFNHPEDFDLYYIADYDDSIGSFICLERPQQIAIGKDMKNA